MTVTLRQIYINNNKSNTHSAAKSDTPSAAAAQACTRIPDGTSIRAQRAGGSGSAAASQSSCTVGRLFVDLLEPVICKLSAARTHPVSFVGLTDACRCNQQ